ncbi:hypothetical protein [Chryseobacterium sp. SL1]|uniref:hypothetical protein n=1 Tax=Chryseobacterium sp. SL1 TaxID=2995159 RepID=UPI002274D10F|nr:hypothetical protein [Chryseobacterium sp. SL1]MCY1660433.1 hypothetical protein [Chryseobacterium sp. SL1]
MNTDINKYRTGKTALYGTIKNKTKHKISLMRVLLLMIFTFAGWQQVQAQNVEVRVYNDLGWTMKPDSFTGSGYTTVNGGSTATTTVSPATTPTMPTTVAGYAGVNVVVYTQGTAILTSQQFDALIEYIRNGGIVFANVELEETGYLDILNRLMGIGHGITKTLANTAGLNPVVFVHPGEGTLRLRNASNNTSTPTTGSYSTFTGVPSAARILTGTNNNVCNGTTMEFVVPTFPGVSTIMNGRVVKGMIVLSGEAHGPFASGSTVFRAMAMNQSYAKLIYDFYNDPVAMAFRRSWSVNTANQNTACVPATFCNALTKAPALIKN